MISATDPATSSSDREIVISRVFDAPRALVWSAMTDPQRIVRWWGPTGFTTTTSEMAVRPGGMWRYVMHGPDGTDYPNWIRYSEVVPQERLAYEHGGGAVGDLQAEFSVVVTFTDLGGRTAMTMRSIFPTTAARDAVVQRYGAAEGGRQTLARLAEQLAAIGGSAPSGTRSLRFTRTFAAPRALVFRAWTEPALIGRWWGPHFFSNPRCEFASYPGGAIRIDMRAPDGTTYPMGGTVLEVTPPQRLAFESTAVDAQGALALRVLNVVGFAERGTATVVTLDATILEATAVGEGYLQGMEAGWNQSFERLADVAADIGERPELEIVTTRHLRFPRALVWRGWVEPALLQRWWGPKGFRNTFDVCEPRPGGAWRFTMHGPDGTDYPNQSSFVELAAPTRWVIDHECPPFFRVVATFAERAGGTFATFRMIFKDVATRDAVRPYAVPGNEENFDRLADVLAGLA